MEKINWNEVQEAQDYKRIVPGGYVCEVVKVEDFADKQYLKVWADVIDGEFKNFGQDCFDRTGKDFGYLSFIRSYKQKALPFFKGFLTALEQSNSGKFRAAAFDGDEKKIIGLKVGLVLGDEEYENKEGKIKTIAKVQKITSIKKIKEGDYEVPELKKLKPKDDNFGTPIVEDEKIPF